MPFDPDAYLAEPAAETFDPDAYLGAGAAAPAAFDPDAYLGQAASSAPELSKNVVSSELPDLPGPVMSNRTPAAMREKVEPQINTDERGLVKGPDEIQEGDFQRLESGFAPVDVIPDLSVPERAPGVSPELDANERDLELQQKGWANLTPEEKAEVRERQVQGIGPGMKGQPAAGVVTSVIGKLASAKSTQILDKLLGEDREPVFFEAAQQASARGLAQGDNFKQRLFGEILPRLAADTPLYIGSALATKGFGTFSTMNLLEQTADKINLDKEFDSDALKMAVLTDGVFKVMPALGIGFKASAGGAGPAVAAELGNIAATAGVFTGLNAVQQWANNEELEWDKMSDAYLENLLVITILRGKKLAQAARTPKTRALSTKLAPIEEMEFKADLANKMAAEMVRKAKAGDPAAMQQVREYATAGAATAEKVTPTVTTPAGRPAVVTSNAVQPAEVLPIERVNAPYPNLGNMIDAGDPASSVVTGEINGPETNIETAGAGIPAAPAPENGAVPEDQGATSWRGTTEQGLRQELEQDGLLPEMEGLLSRLEAASTEAALGNFGSQAIKDETGAIVGWYNQGKVYPEGFDKTSIVAVRKFLEGKKPLTPKQLDVVERAQELIAAELGITFEVVRNFKEHIAAGEFPPPEVLAENPNEWAIALAETGANEADLGDTSFDFEFEQQTPDSKPQTMEEWQAEHGVAPGPEQAEMFGKGAVGDAFELRPETVKGQETFTEKQARQAQASAAEQAQGSMDLGAAVEHRGTAQIPASASEPRTAAPDWVLQRAETKRGRALVSSIGKGDGRKAGLGTIVEMVNEAVGVQMRRSSGQTSRKNPAHYRPMGHVAYTRNTQSQINFHEAGHGLKELVEGRAPAFFAQYANDLIELTKRQGSMASAENPHEGVAEWMRLRVMNPSAVERLPMTAAFDEEIARLFPEVGRSLRDASRAMQAFNNRPAGERWSMVANAPQRLTPSDVREWAIGLGGSISDLLSTGAPLSRLDREMFKATVKDRASAGLSLNAAVERARKTRRQVTEPVLAAHNMVLQIGQEVQKAISGTGADRGLRVIVTENGDNYVSFFPITWKEIVKSIPVGRWKQFQEAGWARRVLEDFEKRGLEYPGQREGISPMDLRSVVEQARKEIPDFDVHAQTVQSFFDAVLDVKDFGGMKAPGEVDKMRWRENYWPVPRVLEGGGGAKPAGNIQAGDYRAKGSGEAIKGLSEVAEERVRDALTAYYWNRLGLKMAGGLRQTAVDPSLPWLTRELAGRVMQPMKMEQAVAASVSPEEALRWIVPDLNRQKAEELGRPLQEDEMIRAEDINLSWDFQDVWRPTAPKDYNVISLLENGKRRFFQVQDPAMFRMFATPDQAGRVSQAAAWIFGPTMQNWKRNTTQSLAFSANNLSGDLINQVMLNKDAVGWFPGGATALGAMNRFSKKYPQVMQEGLLLSRVEPGSVELVNRVKHGAVWQFLTEGFYVSTAKSPAARLALTALQPSNWVYPIWKVGDLFNLVTGGRYVAPRLEGATREGAAVAAKMAGQSDEAANYAYWRVTGTFNEHSGSADLAQLMRMPGFFNPYVQAVRGAGKVLTDPDPMVSGGAWLKLLLLVPTIFGVKALVDFMFMDDDEKKRETERTIDDRMTYHQINGFKIRFPYGPEGSMGSFVYNATLDQLLNVPRTDGPRKARLALNRMVGMGSPLEFMGPQVKTLTEAQMNYSTFRQKNIVSPWMSGLAPEDQFNLNTPKFYRTLGKWAEYSPDKLQFIVQNGLNRQTDEVIRILDRLERGDALAERADLPFVGRMFVRNPNGFNSRSGQTLAALEDKLEGLDKRLSNSGYGPLEEGSAAKDAKGNALQVQLKQLETLRFGLKKVREYAVYIKTYELAGNTVEANNVRRAMMLEAQAVLSYNPEAAQQIETAMEALKQMPELSPIEKANEYLRR